MQIFEKVQLDKPSIAVMVVPDIPGQKILSQLRDKQKFISGMVEISDSVIRDHDNNSVGVFPYKIYVVCVQLVPQDE